tara:strand:+ start:1749 stop:3269 length:1521 start_codon:yes stop_codon:yes gene_type:complete
MTASDVRHVTTFASSPDAPNASASGAPELSDNEKQALRDEAVSWAAQHGLLIGLDASEVGQEMASTFTHAPISLLPTPFPRDVFDLAVAVSPRFAELSDLVSRDHEFLQEQLSGVLETDDFTKALWNVYEQSGGQAGRSKIEVGILRSDYMLDVPSGNPLQVEVNTVSTSFMSLSTRVQQMHKHVIDWSPELKKHYSGNGGDANDSETDPSDSSLSAALPSNSALELAAETLAEGHLAAGFTDAKILMVVQPNERNVFDQRLVANELFETHKIKVTRATLKEIAEHSEIDKNDNGSLLYKGEKHSLVYFRAGYAPTDYPTDMEWSARLLMEQSSAVKSPSAAMQLAGTKKIQQALAMPGVLEKFTDKFQDTRLRGTDTSTMMRKVFAGLYALDGLNGVDPVKNALKSPTQFVLKPQREGGGNNLYGDAMVDVLKTFDKNAAVGHKGDLSQYILMQRIFPPTNTSLCLRKGELRTLETLSELGVYGGYVRVGGTFFYPVISCSPHTA